MRLSLIGLIVARMLGIFAAPHWPWGRVGQDALASRRS
jgi:hypothetical protein